MTKYIRCNHYVVAVDCPKYTKVTLVYDSLGWIVLAGMMTLGVYLAGLCL